jgi:multisubunit Na+/H+ antiporter MnhF subunit
MINIVFEPNILLALLISLIMVLLYFLRIVKPQIARDQDIFFATLGLLYSSILIIHGWRLDPILLFSQVLLIFISLSFCWTLIRQREIIRRLVENI